MSRLFGTDGIRSVAGQFPLDYSSVFKLGQGLIALLMNHGLAPIVLIGKDSRESGSWLNDALFQGIKEASGKAVSVGVIPTPAVSHLTKKHAFSAGIVISASHNPYQDNGIKIFSSQGTKISENWENQIEETIRSSQNSNTREVVEVTPDGELIQEYKDFLKSQFTDIRIQKPYKIVLDCANGASSFYAPGIFSDLGFKVFPINASPNGKNINDNCGSLYPENLAKTVKDIGANIGIAYDGDADRALCVDEKGTILNGDHTLYICAKYLKESGRLKSDTVVATTMSNIGLETALRKMDIKLVMPVVAKAFGVSGDRIKSPSRKTEVVEARFCFCHYVQKHYKITLKEIGMMVNRDHSTIIKAIEKHKLYFKTDYDYRKKSNQALRLLRR